MYSSFVFVVFCYFHLIHSAETINCPVEMTAERGGQVLRNTGQLLSDGYTFEKDDYEETNQTGVYSVCICTVVPCLRKCCPLDNIIVNKTCVNGSWPELPLIYTKDFRVETNFSESNFYLVFGNTCEHGRYRLDRKEPIDRSYLHSTGELSVGEPPTTTLTTKDFCLESVYPSELSPEVFVCFPNPEPHITVASIAYPAGMIISIPFLVITFLVYALLPELHNLHGMSLMSHVAALLTAYIFLVIVQLVGTGVSDDLCVASAFIIQFSFLATFFWLNVMSFDIWWAFSGFSGFRGSVRDREMKRFFVYSCYAWGCPVIILLVSIVLQYLPHLPDWVIRPEHGTKKCFFKENIAQLAYFYGPIAIILACNLVLFALTAVQIFTVKKETKVLSNKDSRRNDDANKQRFMLYLKLFLVMGVNWVMEVLSWAIAGPDWVWYVSDIGNTLQGIVIFYICVLNERILRTVLRHAQHSNSKRINMVAVWYLRVFNFRMETSHQETSDAPAVSTQSGQGTRHDYILTQDVHLTQLDNDNGPHERSEAVV